MSKSNQLTNTVELNVVPDILHIANKAKITVNLIGKQGIGKSQIVYQYADKNKFDSVINVRLGQMEVGDLIGLPTKVQEKDGSWVTIWARPGWWPTKGKHIIFLDEWNRAATMDVIQAIFQLILDRKLHTHILPEECQVVCAMNPADKGFMVNKIKDKALWDRMLHINIVPSTQEFLKWGKNILTDDIYAFVQTSSAVLGDRTFTVEKRDPSARSLEMLSNIQKACNQTEWDNYGSTLAAGLIGVEFGVQFIKFMADRNYKPLKAEDVLLNLDKHMELIKKWINPDDLRLDVLNSTLDNIKAWIDSFESQEAMDKEFNTKAKKEKLAVMAENHFKFGSLLPSDLIQKHASEIIMLRAYNYTTPVAVRLIDECIDIKDIK